MHGFQMGMRLPAMWYSSKGQHPDAIVTVDSSGNGATVVHTINTINTVTWGAIDQATFLANSHFSTKLKRQPSKLSFDNQRCSPYSSRSEDKWLAVPTRRQKSKQHCATPSSKVGGLKWAAATLGAACIVPTTHAIAAAANSVSPAFGQHQRMPVTTPVNCCE